ncbi:MAG: type II toxin-antitoxin system VapC family toxin [Lysobacter sp.]|nr:type II toxin-antitoxin system VapC family toxin [Lysobacter sp.]
MRFWDASAVVPLIVDEVAGEGLLGLLEQDPGMVAWWGTPVECVSAIARREREGHLSPQAATRAVSRLRMLSGAWNEILASDPVRETALRLLRVHSLRAADSLQLAAAVVAADGSPATLQFVCLDERLAVAAEREGFPVVDRIS